MKTKENLEQDIKSLRDALDLKKKADDLEAELRVHAPRAFSFNAGGIYSADHRLLEQAAIAELNRMKAELRELGIETGQDLCYPGVNFTGARGVEGVTIEFKPGTASTVVASLGAINANSGYWTLNANGKLELVTEPTKKPFAIVGDQVFIDESEFSNHFLGLAELVPGQALFDSSELSVDTRAEETHWNKPEDLPPVGCDLMIKVPAGTEVVTVSSNTMVMAYTTDIERVFKVFRTSHLADRAGDMEYRLPDNCTVTGRFPWTYP